MSAVKGLDRCLCTSFVQCCFKEFSINLRNNILRKSSSVLGDVSDHQRESSEYTYGPSMLMEWGGRNSYIGLIKLEFLETTE